MLRNKFFGYGLLILAGFYIVSDPTGAAGTGKDLLSGAGTLGAALIEFFTALSA
jgi:hypothetical protein